MNRTMLMFLGAALLCAACPLHADVVLEPFTYTQNFEGRTLGAWASYPLWQDTAYDPNFRVNEIVPGDPNLSIEERVTPYTNVDNYGGAEKLLDMYLTPESTITFRYYLKTNLPSEFFKVRLAAGKFGKVDFTIPDPPLNRWVWLTVGYNDFVRENPCIAGHDKIKVNALAMLIKIPDADPDMLFYFCFDDITFKGSRAMAFKFTEPEMFKLSEFKPYIPKKHYYKGDTFNLSGEWPLGADKVSLAVVSFTDTTNTVYTADLSKKGETWSLRPLTLSFPEGLYLGKLKAYSGKNMLSDTEFTIHIAPKGIGGKHPRLLFDSVKKQWILDRLKTEKFKQYYDSIPENAKKQRQRIPVESLIYDLDQFPDENWLPTWSAWGSHIYNTDSAFLWNSLAYQFCGDREAGEYAKNVLVQLSTWPDFTHPWQTKRGRFSEHRTGSWSHRVAFAYDCTYDLMTESERAQVRRALKDYLVKGAFKTYVENDNITAKTSNWLAMITGGSLTLQAAMFGDGPDVEYLEPYFTGTMMKYYAFIERVTDSKDGAWGEGFGYNSYSFNNMSYSVPSVMNVFNIDVAKPLDGTYKEYIWAGPVKDKKTFYYGDSGPNLDADSWAFLLNRFKDPLLSWFYHFLEPGNTLWDAVYEIENIPQKNPSDEDPVKAFREVGTTVFKSGWEPDDFIFVMRTGAFYNHQHIDQGSFWLADRGSTFFEERHNSTYYDDPLYQPWYTQPVGHSTILINGNHQSQRVGDHLVFAEGFDDYAFIYQFLNGQFAAFSSGDIGRLYWGKVKDLKRNVLYIKPRTLLMLDTVVPAERDADVTLLYQTAHLENITAGENTSTVSKDGNTLFIRHLNPDKVQAVAVETPHYLYTLQREKPLVKEGMLTVTARTDRVPLVMANMLTSTKGAQPDITSEKGDGFMKGTAEGTPFVFSTRPGMYYDTGEFQTDAAAVTWKGDTVFAALCTTLGKNGQLLLKSAEPITCEVSAAGVKYCLAKESAVLFGADAKPQTLTVNGTKVTTITYDSARKGVEVRLPAGEGMVSFK
ncbi:heparinase II/III-family protein [bacterium]|nr:heparinase II/III-family protein [bacterium]